MSSKTIRNIAEYFTEVSATSSSYKEPLHHNGGSLLVPASTQLVSSSARSANLIAGSSLSEISAASTKTSSLFLVHETGDNTTAKLEWKPSPVPFHFGSFESIQVQHQIPVAVLAPSNKIANHNMSVEFSSVSRSFNTNAMRQYDHHADDCNLDVDRRSDRRAPRHDDFFSDVFNPFSPTRSLNQVLNMMNQFMENPFFNVGNRLCIGISSNAIIRTTTIPLSYATTTQLVGTLNTRIRRLVDGRSIRLPLLYDIGDILIHTQSKSRCYVELYVKDEDAFFRDYEKLSDLGFVPSSKANSPKDRTVLAEGAIGVVVTATAEAMEHACIMFDEMDKRNTSTLLIMAVHTDCTGCLVSKNCWMVYFVFTSALICSNLARTITLRSLFMLWFMFLNVLIRNTAGIALEFGKTMKQRGAMLEWVRKMSEVVRMLEGMGFEVLFPLCPHLFLEMEALGNFAKFSNAPLNAIATLDGQNLDSIVMENVEEAEFVLAHGIEAFGDANGNARSIKLEDLEKILKLCAAKRIRMVVANPDYVIVEERDLRVMPGALAARFLDVFAACLSHNSVFSSLLSKITSTSRSSTQDVRLWDASSILIAHELNENEARHQPILRTSALPVAHDEDASHAHRHRHLRLARVILHELPQFWHRNLPKVTECWNPFEKGRDFWNSSHWFELGIIDV
ncbi:hypothetical protein SESBI_42929 [Sesbania bispinosa]|nr:hypothetical protein SESBI_42929 [Sesbania bispinosa]